MPARGTTLFGLVTAAVIRGARFGAVVGFAIAAISAGFNILLGIVALIAFRFVPNAPTVAEIADGLAIGFLGMIGGLVLTPIIGAAVGAIVMGGFAAIGSLMQKLENFIRPVPDDAETESFP